jgi:hypothetical protein
MSYLKNKWPTTIGWKNESMKITEKAKEQEGRCDLQAGKPLKNWLTQYKSNLLPDFN